MKDDLCFETIDIAKHFNHCIAFREISYLASYGHLNGFSKHYGDGYRLRLSEKIARLPKGNCHIWHHDVIVGQIESKEVEGGVGCINLLSVLPDYQKKHRTFDDRTLRASIFLTQQNGTSTER